MTKFTREEREMLRVFQCERVVVGHCPQCGRVVIVMNDLEAWPPALCECGWADATTRLVGHTRFERDHRVASNDMTESQLAKVWQPDTLAAAVANAQRVIDEHRLAERHYEIENGGI